MARAAAGVAAPLLFAACATAPHGPGGGGGGGWSCVPYARERSGIQLRGDAWTWWDAAAGRHERGRAPLNNSVLVLARSARLPRGHLAVVSRIVSPREIQVDHANWASGTSKGRVARGQPVLDVSPANDWSLVKVWHPSTMAWGVSVHPSRGFVHRAPAVRQGRGG